MWPRWRHDGLEVFYLAPDGKLMSNGVNAHGSTFDAGTARPLVDARPRIVRWPYGVSSDGQRFLVNTLAEQTLQANLPYSITLGLDAPHAGRQLATRVRERVPTR
jgi:hypothetical protein